MTTPSTKIKAKNAKEKINPNPASITWLPL